jgi:hypothetical protein
VLTDYFKSDFLGEKLLCIKCSIQTVGDYIEKKGTKAYKIPNQYSALAVTVVN